MNSIVLPDAGSRGAGSELPPSLASAQLTVIHVLFLMTGMGAMLLGPLLPLLTAEWQLSDERSGLLIAAQFLGSFAGSTTLRPRLKSDLALACAALILGFFGLAFAAHRPQGFIAGLLSLLFLGFGLGRAITAINLIAGLSIHRHRASALTLLNFTWGLGAVLGPTSVAFFANTVGGSGIAAGFAAALIVLTLSLWHLIPEADQTQPNAKSKSGVAKVASLTGIFSFAWLFFFYGGIEAGASNWLSLFTIRSVHGTVRGGATVAASLWIGLTAGRAAAALLMLRINERRIFSAGIILAAGASVLLAQARSESLLVALAIVIGLGLAPAFPALCSLMLAIPRHPRHAGAVMAASSLGGALFPWLIGVISQRSGLWRAALSVQLGLAVVLVLLATSLPHAGGSGQAPEDSI